MSTLPKEITLAFVEHFRTHLAHAEQEAFIKGVTWLWEYLNERKQNTCTCAWALPGELCKLHLTPYPPEEAT